MLVAIVWIAAVVVAAVVLGVLAYELKGHLSRFTAEVEKTQASLLPQVQGLVDRLPAADSGRHRAEP